MIYRCGACRKTSFETTCPWCPANSLQDSVQRTVPGQQVPLDPSFYSDFQYQTKGFLKDLLAKKKEQAQVNHGVIRRLQQLRERLIKLVQKTLDCVVCRAAHLFYVLQVVSTDATSNCG